MLSATVFCGKRHKQCSGVTEYDDYFECLPDDLVISIFCRLSSTSTSPSDFLTVLLTCRRLKFLALHSLVLSKASPKTFSIATFSAQRFLILCAQAGNVQAFSTFAATCSSTMARWNAILSLPVQNPLNLEISSDDLVWSKVESSHDKLDRVALIPFSRVDDFVKGESHNEECPTIFKVQARCRRSPSIPFKQKFNSISEYISYWCSYGPYDHRKGRVLRPNTKRGCTCHFIVKRFIAEPSVALIIYNDDKHVDKKGVPCHD